MEELSFICREQNNKTAEIQLLQETARNEARWRVQTSPTCDHVITDSQRDQTTQRNPCYNTTAQHHTLITGVMGGNHRTPIQVNFNTDIVFV